MIGTVCPRINSYWNPLDGRFIIPIVSSDCTLPSTIWLKNNFNAILRNVFTASTLPCQAVWFVPQNMGSLRDVPSVMLGNAELKLPGLATVTCAIGDPSVQAYLSQNKNVTTDMPPCYSNSKLIQDWRVSATDGCMVGSISNDVISPFLFAENVCYNHGGFMTNFPDTYFNPLADLLTASTNLVQPKPNWLPFQSQNACTDYQNISGTVYCEPTYDRTKVHGTPRYSFQPLSQAQYDAEQATCHTRLLVSQSDALPFSIVNCLSFNLAPMANALSWGAGWTKSAAMLCGCAFLGEGGGNTVGTAAHPHEQSAMFFAAVGDARHKFPNVYHVYQNSIVDVALCMPPNPTVFMGNKTFIATSAVSLLPEYTGAGADVGPDFIDVAVADYYFEETLTSQVFPDTFWTTVAFTGGGGGAGTIVSNFRVFDWSTDTVRTGVFGSHAPITPIAFNRFSQRKYPYLMDADGHMFKSSDALYNQIVANDMIGVFMSPYALNTGERMCALMYRIESCNTTVTSSGLPNALDAEGVFGCTMGHCT